MNSSSLICLWFNSDRTRFFLVPKDQELPIGNFMLRRGVSHQISVDEMALQPYEVAKEAARAWLDNQAGHVMEEVKDSTLEFLERFRSNLPSESSPPDPATLEELATGIETLAAALSEKLRNKARTDTSPESKTDPTSDLD
jgi:hypothetical protein